MKGTVVAVIALMVLAASVTAGVAVIATQDHNSASQPDSSEPDTVSESYAITYVMNGGTNSIENPVSYKAGDIISFKDPTYDGHIFIGWYTDQNFTTEIAGISSDMTGALTVYAQWEVSSVGTVLNYTIDGTVRSNSFFYSYTNQIDGTVSYSYLYYTSEKGYMMCYEESYTVTYYNSTTKSFTESDTYWTSDNDDVSWTMKSDTQTISTFEGDKECEVWVGKDSSHTETQYVGVDSGLAYKIVYYKATMDSVTSITYDLQSTGTIDVNNTYDVIVYCDDGISVTGAGKNNAYTDVKLTATVSSGTTFKGWYSEYGTLLSSSTEYTIDTILSDITVYAMNTTDYDVSEDTTTVSITPSVTLTDVTWTFEDSGTKMIEADTLNYTFSSPGDYTVTYTGKCADGSSYYGYLGVFVDGLVKKTYTWTYNSTNYETSLDILYSKFLSYRNDDIVRSQGTAEHDLEFVTYTDEYVVELAGKLKTLGSGFSDLQMANFILAFTQYIEYQYDEDSMGEEEYWKYPLETLFDQNGDCEDTSILFCAIAKSSVFNYDCCMLLFSGHMAAGIAVNGLSEDDTEGNTFVSGDTTYYYCETTGTGYEVGDYIKQSDMWGREYIVTTYTQSKVLSIIPIV